MPDMKDQPLNDSGNAPVVFADAVTGCSLINGNVHLVFEVTHQMPTQQHDMGEFSRHVACRIVLPFVAAELAAQLLTSFTQRMKMVAVAMDTPADPKALPQ